MQDTRTPSSTGCRRRCAAWRVTFLCVAKEKSPIERPPPLVRPPASGSLGSPVCPTARADGPSMAQRRSLGVLPRGLDKWAHLDEQQGAKRSPQHRGQLTAIYLFRENIGRVVISGLTPRPPQCESRLSHLCNRLYRYGCIGENKSWCVQLQTADIPTGKWLYIEGPIVSISPE